MVRNPFQHLPLYLSKYGLFSVGNGVGYSDLHENEGSARTASLPPNRQRHSEPRKGAGAGGEIDQEIKAVLYGAVL